MNAGPNRSAADSSRLAHLPITLYGSVMGLCGLAIAYLRAAALLDGPEGIGQVILYLTAGWFVILTLIYGVKLIRHPRRVAEEFHHPIKVNFFPAISISLLLLSIGFLHLQPGIARVLWWIGMPLHLAYTLRILHEWIMRDLHVHSINPAWFIPAVGNIVVPVAGVDIASPEVSWFFFSGGLFYWIALFTIVLYRVFFHDPLPQKLMPTLAIMLAPPAVGFIALHKLTGGFGDFHRVLYMMALFTFLLLLTMANRFRKTPYFVSWWAYTFPLAAMTIATMLYQHLTGLLVMRFVAAAMLGLTTVVVLVVLARTVRAALAGEICVPEVEPQPAGARGERVGG